jgi:hypothetical protein
MNLSSEHLTTFISPYFENISDISNTVGPEEADIEDSAVFLTFELILTSTTF